MHQHTGQNNTAFKDEDPKILAVRCIARTYLHKVKLHNPSLNGEPSSPRTLEETFRQELGLDADFPSEVFSGGDSLKIEPVREYDKAREAEETQKMDEAARQDRIQQRFIQLFNVLRKLADEKIPQLDPQEFQETFLPILLSASAFITSNMLVPENERELVTRQNMGKVEEITRGNAANAYPGLKDKSAAAYPGLKDKSAAEYTRTDHHDMKLILRYVHEHSKAMQLAYENLLTATQEIEQVINGRATGR